MALDEKDLILVEAAYSKNKFYLLQQANVKANAWVICRGFPMAYAFSETLLRKRGPMGNPPERRWVGITFGSKRFHLWPAP